MTRTHGTRRGAKLRPHQHLTHSQRVIQGNGRPRTSWWTIYGREDFTAVARAEVQPEIKSYKTAGDE